MLASQVIFVTDISIIDNRYGPKYFTSQILMILIVKYFGPILKQILNGEGSVVCTQNYIIIIADSNICFYT